MSTVRDPAIKLFGRDIPLDSTRNSDSPQVLDRYDESTIEGNVPSRAGKQRNPIEEDNGNAYRSPTFEAEAKVVHKTKDYKSGSKDMDHQEKVFKKPDKLLPCPRCNSLETKFCYFNNYNVNQPRHFCKNCQRYWTAGGIIRNVPVGAGKRKNKHSPLPVGQDIASVAHTDSNPLPKVSIPSGGMGNSPRTGEEAPLCESLETMLNLKGQKKTEVDSSIGDDDSEEPSRDFEAREKECPANEIEQAGLLQHLNSFNPLLPLHYYPAPHWPYQWNHCWNSMVFRPGPAYMGSATMMAVPGFSAPTTELSAAPFYSSPLPSWTGQKEDSLFSGSTFSGILSPSSSTCHSACSAAKSPTLGKHSRDVSTQTGDAMRQNLWVPKTLRINDPEEAARSSIWSAFGTKIEQNKPIIKGSVFKSFEPKSEGARSHNSNSDQILSANPAAFSRLETFQERS